MRFITTLPLPQFDDLHSLLPSTLLWLQYLLSLVPLSGCSSGWTEGGRARRSLEYELGGGGWVKSNRIVSYRMLDLVVTCYAMLCGGDIVQVRSDPNPLVILPTSGISCVLCCGVLCCPRTIPPSTEPEMMCIRLFLSFYCGLGGCLRIRSHRCHAHTPRRVAMHTANR